MKRCYIVSYDIRAGGEYDPLYEALKAYGTWAKITESTWAIVTDETAVQVRDNLRNFINEEDRLFVVKSGVEAAWHKVRCSNAWLKKNL
jgi:hypothetical protein